MIQEGELLVGNTLGAQDHGGGRGWNCAEARPFPLQLVTDEVMVGWPDVVPAFVVLLSCSETRPVQVCKKALYYELWGLDSGTCMHTCIATPDYFCPRAEKIVWARDYNCYSTMLSAYMNLLLCHFKLFGYLLPH